MPGQINRQNIETVVRKVAGLQNPNAMVVQHAVDENDSGFGRVKSFTAGVAVGGVAKYGDDHVWIPACAGMTA
jgi:hypothetical protein